MMDVAVFFLNVLSVDQLYIYILIANRIKLLTNFCKLYSLIYLGATKVEVDEYEGMETDGADGPGPQRCKSACMHTALVLTYYVAL